MWKRILVGHDFSECAGHALEVALGLAERFGASVTLLHVSTLPPNLPADALVTPPGASAAVRAADLTTDGARRRLDAIAGSLRKGGRDVRTLAVTTEGSDASEAILRAAGETTADVVVLGTHGRTGLAHLLLGSVAEKVVRSAPVPVITVRAPAAAAAPTAEEALVEDELAG